MAPHHAANPTFTCIDRFALKYSGPQIRNETSDFCVPNVIKQRYTMKDGRIRLNDINFFLSTALH